MGNSLSSNYRVLASPSRIELLYALQTNGPQTVTQLSARCGLHPNTTREHLHMLIDAGFVASETIHRASRGRPRLRYTVADTASDPRLAQRVREAHARGDQVRRFLNHSDAEQPVSATDRQIDVLEDHLDDCGFDATIDSVEVPDARRITMHHCPFYDLASEHPHVCDVHFGLVRTAVTLSDGPLEATELHARDPHAGCWVMLKLMDRTERDTTCERLEAASA